MWERPVKVKVTWGLTSTVASEADDLSKIDRSCDAGGRPSRGDRAGRPVTPGAVHVLPALTMTPVIEVLDDTR